MKSLRNHNFTSETIIKLTQIQVVSFIDRQSDDKKTVLLLYGLGADGRVYEFNAGKWNQLPAVCDETIKQL